jgi:hypothetical protein
MAYFMIDALNLEGGDILDEDFAKFDDALSRAKLLINGKAGKCASIIGSLKGDSFKLAYKQLFKSRAVPQEYAQTIFFGREV